MTRQVLYVAAPLAPTVEELSATRARHELKGIADLDEATCASRALKTNLNRALRWLAWLRKSFPETTFIAPWIASVMSGDAFMQDKWAGGGTRCPVPFAEWSGFFQK